MRSRGLLAFAMLLATGVAEAADPPATRQAAPAEKWKEVESPHVEVALRRLADGLAAGFGRLPGSAKYRRLAVLAFSEEGEQSRQRQLGKVVAAELTTDLRRDHGLLLVERQKLGQVLGELKLQQMTGVDAAMAWQVGQLVDAQALVLGSVSDAGDRFLVNVRIVAAQSGETLAAESASLPAAGLVSLASDAVVLRSRSDAVFRSLLVPGWGQFYNRQRVKGWVVIGTGVALAGGTVAYQLAGQRAYDDYLSRRSAAALGGTPSAEAAALYDAAASRFRTRNWLLGGLAALWVLNVADAWLSGVDGEAALAGGLAAAPPVPPGGNGLVTVLRF